MFSSFNLTGNLQCVASRGSAPNDTATDASPAYDFPQEFGLFPFLEVGSLTQNGQRTGELFEWKGSGKAGQVCLLE